MVKNNDGSNAEPSLFRQGMRPGGAYIQPFSL